MSEISKWPQYAIGPREAIFSLGMMSINFAELSSILEYIFALIFDIDLDGSRIIVSKIGAENSMELASRRLNAANKIIDEHDLIRHFLVGYKISKDNRNQFMHSELASLFQEKAFFLSNHQVKEI